MTRPIRRIILMIIVAIASVALISTSASAAVKFHRGPTATDIGTQLKVTGNVSGLGNQDLTAVVDAVGVATVTCTNPGGNVAPGQDTTTTTTGTVSGIEPKNGRATFTVITAEPEDPDAGEVCPNSKWDAEITGVDFSSYTLTLKQGDQVIFQQTYPV